MRTQVRHKEGLVNILSRDRECPFSILFVDRISVTPNRVSIHLSLKSAISETVDVLFYTILGGARGTAHRAPPPATAPRGARTPRRSGVDYSIVAPLAA